MKFVLFALLFVINIVHAVQIDGLKLSSPVSEHRSKKRGTASHYHYLNKRNDTSGQTSALFDYSLEKVYGVSLGGWLVTEPYITPSLYEDAASYANNTHNGTEKKVPKDEYHLCKKLGKDECYTRLHSHWDTFINETDIKQIREWGFNTIRLPIGYWAFAQRKEDPFCFGQEKYLDKAIEWCRKYGVHIWVDIHGMPGSQNGFDNSGLRDQVNWLNITENYDLSLEVLDYVARKYDQPEYYDVISGIENVNEPLGPKIKMDKLKKFDKDTYGLQRSVSSDNYFVFHDAFKNTGYWNNVLKENSNITTHTNSSFYNGSIYNIVIDHHRYEVFSTGILALNLTGHIDGLKVYVDEIVKNESIPVKIVGEWSGALTDCAKWVNGVDRGSRYEGEYESNEVIGKCSYSNDYTKMSNQNKTDTRKLIEAQIDLFNKTNGFIFWCYKTENALEFDLSKLIQYGLFPQPLTDRKYPDLLKSSSARTALFSHRLQLLEALALILLIV
ncbi:hypothetical protein FOA43_003327 [Brettanomyces nanus]|uniref:glucan 1,3-beta-glucosidase n=1 Tax=Eeniella nana TaxID=13502 RepID=A0A875S2J5_EENNA|nr:uncharacterized protein FOA43_003327 [Brettanomyces nanus]QPG75941.1 hypothetical protein FOA43_003327 [Brettanomyces nanus]